MSEQTISEGHLTLDDIQKLIASPTKLQLAEELERKIVQCRNYLDEKVNDSDDHFYGINTGFGALCNVSISADQIEELQVNLVKSHACGAGDTIPKHITKLMLLLKVLNLSKGYSGISPEVAQRMLDFYNLDILPVVYRYGSLGASGDLAPLAHLALPILGEGEVWDGDDKRAAAEVLKEKGLTPLPLRSKEGLALLNGTQFMSAFGFYCYQKSQHLMEWANFIAALAIDAFDAKLEPFDDLIHSIRQADSQRFVAETIRSYLADSELAHREKVQVQDPYSFRCIPQVYAASSVALDHFADVLEKEINSVTDNPNIFFEENKILSGGNFHGQPLALVLDYAAMAIAEIGSISERRTYQMISGQRGLPSFLTTRSGLHSGLMIPQYTAASLVSKNKQLCAPASVDTIPSSAGQEDHVSMGANGATKLLDVVDNVHDILAIELLTAAQAIEFRRPGKTGKALENMLKTLREKIPFTDADRILHEEMQACRYFIDKHHPTDFLD